MNGEVIFKPQTVVKNEFDGQQLVVREKDSLLNMRLYFDEENIDVINAMIEILNSIKSTIEMNDRIFIVPIESIIIPQNFKKYNPDPQKILNVKRTSACGFNKNIVVDQNLIIKDGYTAYLVAKHECMKNVAVFAPDGIATVKFGVLKSPKVKVKVSLSERTGDSCICKLYINDKLCYTGLHSTIKKDLKEMQDLFGLRYY